MEKKPVLVIMAAGMGSRYGGLKQIDPNLYNNLDFLVNMLYNKATKIF